MRCMKMIKCLKCGDEFSYGRKICCCNSTYFGMVFNDNKKDYKWNCNTGMASHISTDLSEEVISELSIIDYKKPIYYDWNCETSMRLRNQKKIEEKIYVLIYE